MLELTFKTQTFIGREASPLHVLTKQFEIPINSIYFFIRKSLVQIQLRCIRPKIGIVLSLALP